MQKPGIEPGPVHLRFVVYKKHIEIRSFQYVSLPGQCNSQSAPYSLTLNVYLPAGQDGGTWSHLKNEIFFRRSGPFDRNVLSRCFSAQSKQS